LLVVGCWLLVVGCLVVGCRLLVVFVVVVVFCCNVLQTLLPLRAPSCCWRRSVDNACMWALCMLYVGCAVCRLYVYIDM
jgi:hypothetical protein